ncbi:MAG: hypothetical protein IT262_01445 [Saprospiraceae bacterium]|nr:hypothetical protein [Saprospiraceae bacterium]
MYHIAEQNERRSRRQALVLAVVLHLALGALLYLQTSEPTVSSDTTAKVKTEKPRTVPTQSRP